MRANLNPGQRLLWFIDAVLMEERKFCSWCRTRQIDRDQLVALHNQFNRLCEAEAEQRGLRAAHLALLERHRVITREHEDISRYCLALMNKINDLELSEEEMSEEVEHLAALYEQIRFDHKLMEHERQELLREHDEAVRAGVFRA
jgi:hypothetical protein